jgi:hypothetical protein
MARKRKLKADLVCAERPQKRPTSVSLNKSMTIDHSTLSLYYPQVMSLRSYVLKKIPTSSKTRRRRIHSLPLFSSTKVDVDHQPPDSSQDSDTQLAYLLDTTLIGCSDHDENDPNRRREDFVAFSQNQGSTVSSSFGEGTTPQHEVGNLRCPGNQH